MKGFWIASDVTMVAFLMFLATTFWVFPSPAFPDETSESPIPTHDPVDDRLHYLREETYVITPAKISQRIDKAPGSIYVVTDRRIREIGASNFLFSAFDTRTCR